MVIDAGASRGDEARLARATALGVAPSKVLVPWTRPGLVWRTQLVERLESAPEPVVLLTAPAGYGKTTLLTQWAAATRRSVAWVSLDDTDNAPSALVRSVAAAFDGLPGSEALLRELAKPRVSEGVQLRLLASFLSVVDDPYLLVLDHFEALHAPECLEVVREIALVLSPGSRFAIASRAEGGALLARGRAEGRVHEVRAGELRLDLAEATCVLEACGAEVDADQLVEVLAHTEGWPAGVYLAGLAMRDEPADAARYAPRGDDRYLADYLRAEILDRLDPDLRSFLVQTSFLERISAPLCDTVLDGSGSARRLELLEHQNLLVVPLDRTRTWYRYHHLLRDLLRAELAALAAEEVAELHRRAAGWFEAHAEPASAVAHAQAAGDDDLAARLVLVNAVPEYASGRAAVARAWIAWFERRGTIAAQPGVAVLGGLLEVLTGHATDAERFARMVEDVDTQPQPLLGGTPRAWACVLRAAMCDSGPEQACTDGEEAVAALEPASPVRPGAYAFLALGHQLLGRDDLADLAFARAVEAGESMGEMSAVTGSMAARAMVAVGRRDWRAAAQLSAAALEACEQHELGDYVTSLLVFAVASRVAARRGDSKEAAALAARAQRLRPLATHAFIGSVPFLLQLAHAHLELADPAGARSVLRQIRDIQQLRPDLGVAAKEIDELHAALSSMGTGHIGVTALTTSELRVLPFLATHLTLRDIADRLYLSRHTVKTHALSIYRKVGASSRSEAVERLSAAGLLEGDLRSG